MAAQPPALTRRADIDEVLKRSAGDSRPVTLDLDAPCPEDATGATVVLWYAVRDLRTQVAALVGQLAARM